jgi:hypothetical protein
LISTPLQIAGLKLWLDAADPDATGNPLSQSTVLTSWNDKSGNSTITTAYNSSLMGINSVVFSGSNWFTAPYSGTSKETAFVVMTANLSGDILCGSSVGSRQFSVGTLKQLEFNSFAGPSYAQSEISILQGSVTMESYSLGISSIALYQNGTQIASDNLSEIDDNIVPGSTLYIGANPLNENSSFLSGSINEILIFSTTLSTTDRQQVEGYLAAKWSFASTLSITNPYSAVPAVDPVSVGGGGGGASGILFPDGTSMFIAGAGAGGYFDGINVYEGGAGGLSGGSEPSGPVPVLVTSLALKTDFVDRGSDPQTVTVNGTVPFSTIQGVQCAYFDNSTSDYLSFPYSNPSQVTFSFWINTVDNGSYGPMSLSELSFQNRYSVFETVVSKL